MEKEFIPYEQALALKELGFDEPCAGEYKEIEFRDYKGGVGVKITKRVCLSTINGIRNYNQEGQISAPTFSQAFRFFREKYDLFISIIHYNNGYAINHLRRFDNYEEAELECLKKLIEIIKDK